ncbi:MAG TPA: hypothetical protein PLY93_05325, partial [Turneriella sp.]|nr:hypothetical protein [Turneriella sp.]
MITPIKRNLIILKDAFRQSDAPAKRRFFIFFILTTFTVFTSGLTFSIQSTTQGRYTDAALYTLALILIMSVHAFSRFVQARSYGVYSALPLFIPMPLFSPFGTIGVATRTASVGLNARALFDIAFWGPFFTFILSVVFLFIGVLQSDIVPIKSQFENPLILTGILALLKDIPPGYDVAMHPLTVAGWAGLLFTAINLFPLGSLSGGQIAYALFGRRQRDIGYLFMAALFIMALYYPLWFAFVIAFIYLGVEHPAVRQAVNPLFSDFNPRLSENSLDRRRQLFALLSACIFAVSFTLTPFGAS